MDKRKKYFLLIDVETAGGLNNPLVYDLGFAIVDKKGKIYQAKSFLISQIFNDTELMSTAYYKEKIPFYKQEMAKGRFTLISWERAIKEMNEIAVHYNAKVVAAYNLAFDMKAMTNTNKYLGYSEKILSYRLKGIKTLCLWGLACETIFSQKTYAKVAVANKWISEAGNMKTNAEVAYRYITGDASFVEQHTGLADVEIEAKIMADCFRQHKKISRGIISHPWKIPNNRR